ncbi:hypothetical protein FRC0077_02347 [Corynebacterium diphtheriae]|nr:hypothetical protein FRC0077_02347 [Corynebacterium diphtheriae]CAB0717543.1 hypothetical protein FRC0076_02345 [Corynebacterium diphtheriae]
MLLGKSTVLRLSIVAGRCQNGKRRKVTQFLPLAPPGVDISLTVHDFFVRRWLYTGVQTTRGIKRALPVLECIDCVSHVGGVDQAPQNVAVEVDEDVLAALVYGLA